MSHVEHSEELGLPRIVEGVRPQTASLLGKTAIETNGSQLEIVGSNHFQPVTFEARAVSFGAS